ncbi:hypothetical protein ICM05_08200 [Leucobacter sp. cx-42]|uniref:hypothetical protein n=1 Tax=unclassified Leucobacter TaxID=2621730 RepID=UPI00165DF552|nr:MULTISPECIES: hypothetical protein [unclassified Leucobacter]MBC9954624.1 hypothetical protein [Leucobacter sp. cx-42]
MSEQERPLTRRELRAREEAERAHDSAANEQPVEPVEETVEEPAPITASIPEVVLEAIEISPVHEDGTPRSRREMRQLREEAVAALQEEVASENFAAEVLAPAVESVEAVESGDVEPEAEIVAPGAADLFAEVPAIDDTAFPETAPYTFEELKLAEEPSAEAADAGEDAAPVDSADTADGTEESDGSEQEAKSKRGFGSLWRRGKKSDEAESAEAESANAEASDLEDAAEAETEAEADIEVPEDSSDAEQVEASVEADELPVTAVAPVVGEEAVEEESPASDDAPAYTFPDIRPPEEWHPVIDDPASRVGGAAAAQGDFESLISRAVAQEGAASPSNTSALILPSHPEATDSLTGPLGMTGELFVTGAIHLPKSLGETGTHASLQHSAEYDPFVAEVVEDSLNATADHGVAPVSARAAVSAQTVREAPVVAAPTREKSKLPMILALSGGGLVVVVGGIIVWAVNSGAF